MQSLHVLGLGGLFAALGIGAWIGCSSDPIRSNTSALDGGGEAGAEDAGSRDVVPEPECDVYCEQIMALCTGGFGADGGNSQYLTKEGCLNLCDYIDPGLFEDRNRDTLGCRLNALADPSLDLPTKCKAAGSTGGGICATESDGGEDGRCYAFCRRAMGQCAPWNGVERPFQDFDTCLTTCYEQFPFDRSQPEFTQSGNTLNCRQFQVLMMYEDGGSMIYNPGYYCPNVGYPAVNNCK